MKAFEDQKNKLIVFLEHPDHKFKKYKDWAVQIQKID